MLVRRVIPCLDVRENRVVKGIKFQGLRDAGDPAELAADYQDQGADEIVVLDVAATPAARDTQLVTVESVRAALSIPLTVGGGIRSLDDATRLTDAGADRVSVNTAAVKDPDLIGQMADRFGRQCVVLALDASRADAGHWQIRTHSGDSNTGIDAIHWAREVCQRGAGEILLTSFDRDGTREGYDLELIQAVAAVVSIPIIASGGASTSEHMFDALQAGASAVLAATILHDGLITVGQLKAELSA